VDMWRKMFVRKNFLITTALATAIIVSFNEDVRKLTGYYTKIVHSNISSEYNVKNPIVETSSLDSVIKSEINSDINSEINKRGLSYNIVKDTVTSKNYNIVSLEIENLANHDIRVVLSEKPTTISKLVNESTFGINASFYDDYDNVLRPMGLIKSRGEIVSDKKLYSSVSGYFVITNGIPTIQHTLDTLTHDLVLQSYPLLILNGEKVNLTSSNRNYRSAIALDKDRLYFITTENKPLIDKGVTLGELQEFMIRQGYTHALNLDGGKSTQMIKKPQLYQPGYDKIVNAIIID
jgi:exopolysaccharide biosynthesis protein